MIPTLIILLVKKYKTCGSWRVAILELQTEIPPLLKKAFQLLLLITLLATTLRGQKNPQQYNIFHDGEKVGYLNIVTASSGNRIHLKMESEVNTRMIFRINVFSRDETISIDGKIIYSSIYRNVNGDEKSNQQLKITNTGYQLVRRNRTKMLNQETLHYNMLHLYIKEPVDIRQVYSDNFQQLFDIKKVDSNRYKVSLPNGSVNYYSYYAGICTKVEVNHSLYSLEFILQ